MLVLVAERKKDNSLILRKICKSMLDCPNVPSCPAGQMPLMHLPIILKRCLLKVER